MGDQHCHACVAIGCQGRAGIKAKPANPEHTGTGYCHGQIVRRHSLVGEAAAITQYQSGNQSANTSCNVNYSTTSEIEKTHFA